MEPTTDRAAGGLKSLVEDPVSWRPSRRLSTPALVAAWLSCALLVPTLFGVQTLLGTASAGGVPVALVRPTAPLTLLWLLLAWGLATSRGWRVAGVVATAALGLQLAVPLLVVLDVPRLEAVREVGATLLQALVALVVVRWRGRGGSHAPHRTRDVVALLQAVALGSVAGALVAVPLGPATLAWALLGTAHAFVGVVCVLLLVHRRPRDDVPRTRWSDLVLVSGATAAVVGVVVVVPAPTLSWLVLVPAVLAGLRLGPWSAAAFGLLVGVAVAALQVVQLARGPQDPTQTWSLPALVAAFVAVVLVLSLGRDQRDRLSLEVVRRRQAAVDQAGLLQTLLESISDALVLVDGDGEVQLHNRAALALLGDARLRTEPRRWVTRRREQPGGFTYAVDTDDEATRVLSVHLAPVQYAGAGGTVAVARDTTREHHRLEELTSFAAVAAHDLKTPLTAVMGWLEVAEDQLVSDPDSAAHALRRGLLATQRMTAEIEDWLAYTVAREGELSLEAVPLAPLLAEVASTYDAAALRLRADDSVLADRTLLRHLLANLVGNAVKYTRPGEQPDVTVTSEPDDHDGWVRVHVVDRGIGIPAGEEAAVFEPFRRASTVAGEYEGSGLGLALCKRIVRRHGGTIVARRNDDGPGTTVSVRLPAPRPSRATPVAQQS